MFQAMDSKLVRRTSARGIDDRSVFPLVDKLCVVVKPEIDVAQEIHGFRIFLDACPVNGLNGLHPLVEQISGLILPDDTRLSLGFTGSDSGVLG